MQPLDPLYSVALSLHHSPGVYALLLGSGLSRAAGIPTGYELTLSLTERLGAVQGATNVVDWSDWYRAQFGRELNYSEVLDLLAKTPAERRAVLHSFIERDADGSLRTPSAAHKAIARLVASGTIKTIITTNFDRLIETALREAGVEPTIIASEDAVAGATPLVHSACTIIKVHGDYLDTRIRNTEPELASLPAKLNDLLDEVFDRYGLICAGWSGDWDEGLRKAIVRTASRRYPMYWLTRGEPSATAQTLIDHRNATVVVARDADAFFVKIDQLLQALKESQRPHPLSVTAAVGLAKKYVRRDEYGPEWTNFVAEELEKVLSFVNGLNQGDWPNTKIKQLADEFFEVTEVMRRACVICARWGTAESKSILLRSLWSLGERQSEGGYVWWSSIKRFPALICWFAALVGAMGASDYAFARDLLYISFDARYREGSAPAFEHLDETRFDINWDIVGGTPMWLRQTMFERLKDAFKDIAVDVRDLDRIFNTAELLLAMEYTHYGLRTEREKKTGFPFWVPLGRFLIKRINWAQQIEHLQDIQIVQAGLFGGNPAEAKAAAEWLSQHIRSSGGRILI